MVSLEMGYLSEREEESLAFTTAVVVASCELGPIVNNN